VGTVGTFDPGLFANPSYPLIGANWRISRLAGLAILKPARIDVIATPEERSEECDLNFRWREMIHVGLLLHCFRTILAEKRGNAAVVDAGVHTVKQ
jgi:hypothetical protein